MKNKSSFLAFLFCVFAAMSVAQQPYFPPIAGDNWETVTPESLGWCSDKIPAFYDYLEQTQSKGVMVLKDGKIVLEKYFGTFTKDSLWYWASAGKSLTAVLIGMAQAEGKLSINDLSSKYLGKGWTALPEAKENLITIRHQLTMTTGLDDSGDKDCTLPSCLAYKADAGTRWAYHNAPYTLLDKVIEGATGQTLNQYYIAKLRNKIGMNGLYVKVDDNNVNFSTLRSFARFGLLMLHRGKWESTQLVPLDYVNTAINSSQNLNLSYGYLWWLNGKTSYMIPSLQTVFNGSLVPNAPSDMYAAIGKNGQIINIVPSQNLVLVRMGISDNSPVSTIYDNAIWQRFNAILCNATSTISAESDEAQTIKVFPNPATDRLFLEKKLNTNTLKAKIFDTFGRVFETQIVDNSIDISALSEGIYFLTLNEGAKSETVRFVVP